MNFLSLFILSFVLLFNSLYGQSPPSDFKLEATTGGIAPWSTSESITILADGQAEFVRIQGSPPQILRDTAFIISAANVQQIWQAVQNNNFFSLNNNYQDDSIRNGSIALLTITANGTAKQVRVKNIKQESIQDIISLINSNVPSDFNLDYTPPEKFNIVPTDPCGESLGFSNNLSKKNLPEQFLNKTESNYRSAASLNEVQFPHGGVEIGCEMSLMDAVAAGAASLSSKGEYFGDGISITGDNTNPRPPCNTLKLKLNLEFYGPCDNDANELKIVSDIYKKWNGLTTSDGKKIEMDIGVLSHPNAATPPGTPGFSNIKLECGKGRSFVSGLGQPNSSKVSGGTWFPSDNGAGVFGHEAGHLIGLDDQYDDYNKQPDGNWKNSNDGSTLSNNEFVSLLDSKYPQNSKAQNTDIAKKSGLISIPRNGQENNLMGDVSKPPLQSDIDRLASMAGLIIKIEPGDILSNTDNDSQNLLVIRTESLFLNFGEKKTLNGIYTACIDNHKFAPDSGIIFNAVPSLDKWNGVLAAQYLLKLAKYIDKNKLYCGSFLEYYVQESIWRLTDNSLPLFSYYSDFDQLLKNAGIDIITELFYFPRLTSVSKDSNSKAVIPKELFIPDIQPKAIQGSIGENLSFNAEVSKPAGFNFTASSSLILNPPEGSLSSISLNGDFTPDTKGIYNISVKIDITDSVNTNTEYYPEQKAYAVIPDNFTETFEHASLERFHWDTYGDSKWEITNDDAQTGSYSVRSEKVVDGQTTTLSIPVSVTKDTLFKFALKIFTNFYSSLGFYVDSLMVDSWAGSSDWQFFEYNIEAGDHKLMWVLVNGYDNPAVAWLDNIFFPANSVVTGVNLAEQIPITFELKQNYPNPFNPKFDNLEFQNYFFRITEKGE